MLIHIPPIVAVDSSALVLGTSARSGRPSLNAQWLFEQFTERKTQVIVPSVVLSEYLTDIEVTGHAGVIAAMDNRFLFSPFNLECASLGAELYRLGSRGRLKGVEGERAILRADSLIIATAKIHGAGMLYSADIGLRKLANKIWPGFACDIPEPPKDLFDEPLRD